MKDIVDKTVLKQELKIL